MKIYFIFLPTLFDKELVIFKIFISKSLKFI